MCLFLSLLLLLLFILLLIYYYFLLLLKAVKGSIDKTNQSPPLQFGWGAAYLTIVVE